MASNQIPTAAPSGSICNAEFNACDTPLISASPPGEGSFVNRKAIADLISEHRSQFRQVFDAQGANRSQYAVERREIAASKVALCSTLLEQIAALPVLELPADLMGRKPILRHLSALLQSMISSRRAYAEDANPHCGGLPDPAAEIAWNRYDSVCLVLDSVLQRFSGNAEEQPEPREESRPVIGESPVTPAGATFREDWTTARADYLPAWLRTVPSLTSYQLRTLAETALDELQARGEGDTWTVAETL